MPDQVIEELWAVKDSMAREHGNDVRKLATYLQTKKNAKSARITDLGTKKPKARAGPQEG